MGGQGGKMEDGIMNKDTSSSERGETMVERSRECRR